MSVGDIGSAVESVGGPIQGNVIYPFFSFDAKMHLTGW